jgi:hypothetical protein
MLVHSQLRHDGAVTVTKTIKVAAGVFAAGHLGELTQHVPFELASILRYTRKRQ